MKYKNITKEELLKIGFDYLDYDDDPFYRIIFKPPFMFNTQTLSGYLKNGTFHLYGNDKYYNDINELEKVINIFKNKNKK
jgi:hypothetical protein